MTKYKACSATPLFNQIMLEGTENMQHFEQIKQHLDKSNLLKSVRDEVLNVKEEAVAGL